MRSQQLLALPAAAAAAAAAGLCAGMVVCLCSSVHCRSASGGDRQQVLQGALVARAIAYLLMLVFGRCTWFVAAGA
jgi:hypothetical protein